MDNSTVYIKTKEGEEAVRQRTRLVQRNLRNILIMVDGHASVADLARRFGDAAATDAALRELQSSGFIVELGGEAPFTDSPPQAEPASKVEDVPVLTSAIETGSSISPFSEPPSSMQHASLPPEFDDAPPVMHEYESLPPTFNPAEAWQSSPPPKAAAPNVLDKVKSATAGMGAKLADLAKRKAKPAEQGNEPLEVQLEPIRRMRRLPAPWPVLALLALAGLCLLSVFAAMLFPYERYLPDLERKAGAALKDPVKIGTIGFSILPRPHIALGNIRVGQAEHLTVAKAMAVPEVLSLFGDSTVVSELVLEKPLVNSAGLGRLAQVGQSPGMTIQRIVLKDLGLVVGETVFGGLQGEVAMDGSGVPTKIHLSSKETLTLELTPGGGGFRFAALGTGWQAVSSPGLTVDRLDAIGELKANRLELGKLDGKAYDGLVEGKLSLDWSSGFRLKGEFVLTRLNATRVLTALGSDFSGAGELNVKLRLDGVAGSDGALWESLRSEAVFEVGRGEIKGFDLGEAVRNTGASATQGGATKFEQLSGTLVKTPDGMRLANLRLSSGLLQAGGNLALASGGQLSGAVDVELKSSARPLRMALLVGGTSKAPLLTPARGR